MAIKSVPYKPSWVDRFLDWLEKLPGPTWVSVLLIYLGSVVIYHLADWFDGMLPFGQIDPEITFNGLWSIVGITFLLLLNRNADRAIAKFSLLLPKKKKQLEALHYEMTHIPARAVLVLTIAMFALIAAGSIFDPAFLGVTKPLSKVVWFIFAGFSYAFAPIMLYHGVRQLNLVTKAYRLVDEINLFHLQPLYAFSGLTMTSSLFWILILNMNFVSNSTVGQSDSFVDFLLSTAFYAPYIVLAFVTFIVPLWGIHRRIQNRKEAELEKNGMQIEKAHEKLYGHLNKGEYKKGNELEKSLASLYKMREQIEKVPTWPWNPGTLRSFLTAVFVPMGIWLTQQLLLRLL